MEVGIGGGREARSVDTAILPGCGEGNRKGGGGRGVIFVSTICEYLKKNVEKRRKYDLEFSKTCTKNDMDLDKYVSITHELRCDFHREKNQKHVITVRQIMHLSRST